MQTVYKYLTLFLLPFLLTCTDDNLVDVRLEVDHKAPWVEWLEPLGGSEVAGAVVTGSIPDNVVAYGVPAKIIRDNDDR